MRKIVLLLLITTMVSSCNSKRKVDLILYNGTIYTVDESFSITEAVAVRGGIIKAIGSSKDILEKYDADIKTDLQGQPLYPGFIDGHCHFYGYGIDMLKCNLYGTASFDEVLDKVTEFSKTNKFEWLLGRG